MSTDEYKKLCDNLDTRILLHQTIKEPISQDLDNLIKLSVAYDELQEENEELKKQLEEANKKLYLCTPEIPRNVHGEYVSYVDLVNNVYESKKQQQEFIRYINSYIELLNNKPDLVEEGQKDILEEVLNKYKEIIGTDIHVGSKGE